MIVRFQTAWIDNQSTCIERNRRASVRAVRDLLVRLLVVCVAVSAAFAQAQEAGEADTAGAGNYLINAGDVLQVEVWNEPTLSKETILVRPDGFISVPVIGEIKVGGGRVADAVHEIKDKLVRYLKDEPNVVVSVLQTRGSQIYVLGKVLRPGAFPLSGNVDIAQALALAGGTNQFAAENKIKVFRRDADGVQRVYKFKLGDIKAGDKLESNILLQSGDLVLVP